MSGCKHNPPGIYLETTGTPVVEYEITGVGKPVEVSETVGVSEDSPEVYPESDSEQDESDSEQDSDSEHDASAIEADIATSSTTTDDDDDEPPPLGDGGERWTLVGSCAK
jgi:hypothetical protein